MLRGRGGTARYLRGAVAGIALSLVPLIVVMEVSTGMIDGIMARLLEVGTYHLQVSLPPDTALPRLLQLASDVASVRDVAAAVPERQGTVMLVGAHGATGASIRCVPPDVFRLDAGLRSFVSITAGSADLSESGGILLSAALAATLGVSTGDTVHVLTTYGADLRGPPRLTPLRVTGIYETGYQELDKTLAYASLGAAGRILSPRASRTLLGVKVRDPFMDLGPVAQRVAKAAGDARVATWDQIEYARLASFRTTKALLLFIMALVVIVASVNVSSSVLMIIFERRHDLGILKSVGAGPGPLSAAFLFAGLATGFLGAAGGIGLGLLVAVNINSVIAGLEWAVNGVLALISLAISTFNPSSASLGTFTLFNSAYYLKSIPIRIEAREVIAAAIATLLLSAVASYLPAARAARTRPLEILRKV